MKWKINSADYMWCKILVKKLEHLMKWKASMTYKYNNIKNILNKNLKKLSNEEWALFVQETGYYNDEKDN